MTVPWERMKPAYFMFYIIGLKKTCEKMKNVFDIIIGTSIGAINASIIINHFLENKEKDTNITEEEKPNNSLKYWERSPEKLLSF